MKMGFFTGFFTWHEKLAKSVSERSLNFALAGKMLAIFALGAIFSIELVQYAYFMLIASVLLLVNYVSAAYKSHIMNKKVKYSSHAFGVLGLFLLLLFFGIQSPQIPFQIPLLVIGIALTLPALVEAVRGNDLT